MPGRFRRPLDRFVTASNLVDELLRRHGDCLVSRGGDFTTLDGRTSPDQNLSDLHAEVCALGSFLIEEAGLQPGQRVAIWRSNSVRCFRWFLAIIRAGGVAVPLNPLLTLSEVRPIVEQCGPSVIVTDSEVLDRYPGARDLLPAAVWIHSGDDGAEPPGMLRVRGEWLGQPPLAPARIEPDATVAIFHTSGTEGRPKSVPLSSRSLLASRVGAALFAPLAGRDALALVALPWSHIMAVSTAIFGLMAGIPACCLDHFDPESVIAAVNRHKITAVVGVPAMLARLVNAQPPRELLASIRLWVSASDHLPPAVRQRLLVYGAWRRLGRVRIRPVLLNAYGMVEVGGIAMIAFSGLYIAVPPRRVRVFRENGEPAARGEVGECAVKGPGLASGYGAGTEGSAGRRGERGWLRTGDLGVRNMFGLIRLVGRSKDVIKCGGYSVYPSEIENVLCAHPAVARAAAVGVADYGMGEVPVGVVELRNEVDASEADLLAWCQGRLAAYKSPRRICIWAEGCLPRGVTHKVLKHTLRARLERELPQPGGTPATSAPESR